MLTINYTFGIVARILRVKKGLKQNQLGVCAKTVNQMELGNTDPELKTLKTVAEYLGTTVEAINAEVNRLNGMESGDTVNQRDFGNSSPYSMHHELLDTILNSKRKDAEAWRNTVFSCLLIAEAAISSNLTLDYKIWERQFLQRTHER